MRLVLATRSADKLTEVRAILAHTHDIEILSLRDVSLPHAPEEDAVEVYATFRENALAKARYFAARLGDLPVLADDSGLEVDALGGAPGVRTRRFALDEAERTGTAAPDAARTDVANNALLLRKLQHTPDGLRGARYVCAAAFVDTHGTNIVAIGTCTGRIAREPKGTGGFGYDPLFLLPGAGVTFGELSAAQKHERSHRAHAFRALATVLPTHTRGVDPRISAR
jgi:XTP/dITP diphosphohydrolase